MQAGYWTSSVAADAAPLMLLLWPLMLLMRPPRSGKSPGPIH